LSLARYVAVMDDRLSFKRVCPKPICCPIQA
jgi:hypothetical protein